MSIPRPANVPSYHLDSWDRLSEFAIKNGRTLHEQLGWGNEGLVYSTTSKTAIKAYLHENLYENERRVYERLSEKSVTKVRGFAVPIFVAASDELRVLEMTIVSPPFIIDFAGAYLDKRPPYADDEEILEGWEQNGREQFGDERWSEVKSLVAAFAGMRIYLNDVHSRNLIFAGE
jgi:hypothetical protein